VQSPATQQDAVGMHVPAQSLKPSLQAEPHVPSVHVEWALGSVGAGQEVPVPVWQVPPEHRSPVVQALPSSQVAPSDAEGLVQTPVAGSHVPATWHWSDAEQTTGSAPEQVPA
jgi:hypothetical protein